MKLKVFITVLFLGLSFSAFSQKVKLKKGEVLVDDVLWLKYDGCGAFQSNCSVMNLNGEEIIFIKEIDVPYEKRTYFEVKFLGTKMAAEFENVWIKRVFEMMYKDKVVDAQGQLDEDRVRRFIEKYGTPVSDRNKPSTTNTIIIHDKDEDDDKPNVNISIGR